MKCVQQSPLQNFRFHSASIKDSGLSGCDSVTVLTLPGILKALHYYKISGNLNPVTQHHIPKDLNLKPSLMLPFWVQFSPLLCNVTWHQHTAPLESQQTNEHVWYFEWMDKFWKGTGLILRIRIQNIYNINVAPEYMVFNLSKTVLSHYVSNQFKEFLLL